jgi:hypothetical protein
MREAHVASIPIRSWIMTEPETVKRRSPLSRVLRVVLVVVLLAIVAVAFLPTILSSEGFRNRVVTEANRNLGGTVELGQLQLGWTGEQRVAGLRLWPGEAGQGEPLLDLPTAAFQMEILPLLQGRLAVQAEVTDFEARLVVHEDGSTNLEEFLGVRFSQRPEVDAPDVPSGPTHRDVKIEAPGLVADIVLKGGTALLVDEQRGLTTGVENLVITATSKRYNDPLELAVDADLRLNEIRSPFALQATALGRDDPGWSLGVQAERLQPGSLTAPLLAAAFPLLAGDGSGEPIEISAPLDLDLSLSGTSLEETLSGELSSLTGNIGVGLGEGGIEGGVFGRVQEALGGLAGGQGLQLPAELSETLSLKFHGFSGQLAIADGRVAIEEAFLGEASGEQRPLPIEGYATLDGTLHYRIPWTGLLPGTSAAKYLAERALTIEGPLTGPELGFGLEGLLDETLKAELDQKLEEAKGELQQALDEALEEKLGEDADKLDLGGLLRDKLKKDKP